jgi:cardiolipin synthase A/B
VETPVNLWLWVPLFVGIIDLIIKIVAVGTVPTDRRPSSSIAWLLFIFVVPIFGLIIFLLIGSPFVRGRRAKVQEAANDVIAGLMAEQPELPPTTYLPAGLQGLVALNRQLTSLPCVLGTSHGLISDPEESSRAMAEAVDHAAHTVHVEFFIMAWDDVTEPVFAALARAVQRGVKVRLLYDHVATRSIPGFKELNSKLTATGIEWYPMMPIQPLKGKWRRPDLRNHRKMLVVDSSTAFMGSQNLITPSYLKPKNIKDNRNWRDLNIKLTGEIVASLELVFATDWFSETGERLDRQLRLEPPDAAERVGEPMQLIPSGPGYQTIPNLRLFTALVHYAQHALSVTSPYFVPDESLLEAFTTAAHRGVAVELFVSEEADQFVVQHAQASYYRVLLEAGVRIYLYPKPTVLHAKHFTVDDSVGVIGSSNMDYRSFGLDYEISLMTTSSQVVQDLQATADEYRQVCRELTLADWSNRATSERYKENVSRLVSSLQ